ncbi:hypothetical protein BDQ17DRAFT_1352713 [Cyathus striatus]|nr:hypothetical protein BDQ17DRAFT_1352713 [Cyathus striatus]
MVDGDLFDKLATIGSILRKDLTPFGGIQVGRHYCIAITDVYHCSCRLSSLETSSNCHLLQRAVVK